jgi:hypothetical protein
MDMRHLSTGITIFVVVLALRSMLASRKSEPQFLAGYVTIAVGISFGVITVSDQEITTTTFFDRTSEKVPLDLSSETSKT